MICPETWCGTSQCNAQACVGGCLVFTALLNNSSIHNNYRQRGEPNDVNRNEMT